MSYSRLPAFVLGFHGCDRAVADRVIAGKEHLKASENEYDLLGHGIYFWENDPARALRWAQERAARAQKSGKSFDVAVVGAVIDLGNCLDLLNAASIDLVEHAYAYLKQFNERANVPLPLNEGPSGGEYLRRKLDCAVINFLHERVADDAPFDRVRAAFLEGEPVYPNAGFRRKNHLQICVRNVANIKGYLHPFE